jgi:hypothetical protein
MKVAGDPTGKAERTWTALSLWSSREGSDRHRRNALYNRRRQSLAVSTILPEV